MERTPGRSTLACLALLLAVPLLCLYLNPYPDILLRDQWRMVPLLVDYFSGQLRISSLFAPHHDVSIVIYKTLFLLNGILLGLNMPAEYALGIFLLFLYTCVLFTALRRSLGGNASVTLLVLAPLLAVIYSQSQTVLWHFSLVAVLAGVLLFFSVLTVVFLDRHLEEDGRPRHAVYSLLCLLFLVLGDTTATFITLIALALLLGLLWFLRPETRKKILPYAGVLFLFFAAAGTLQFFYSHKLHPAPPEGWLLHFLTNIPLIINYVFLLSGSSLYTSNIVDNIPRPLLWLSGAVVLLAYAGAVWLYIRHRRDIGSSLPLFLILFSAAFAAVLILSRATTTYGPPTAPRYVTPMRVGFAGLVWIYGHWVLRLRSPSWRRRSLAAGLCTVILLEGLNLATAQRYNTFFYTALKQQISFLKSQQYDKASRPLAPGNGVRVVAKFDMELRRLGLGHYRDAENPEATEAVQAAP